MNVDPRTIAAAALGRDPGPLAKADSRSNQDVLRTECEAREAHFLAYDIRYALEQEPAMLADRLRDLEQLIVGRHWWRSSKA
jgi:hypothetical protein